MNSFSFLLVAAAVAVFGGEVAAQQCTFGVQPRKSWRDLKANDKSRYLTAYKKLQERPDGGLSYIDGLAKMHYDNAGLMHGTPQFFPWHRRYLYDLESTLQSTMNQPITVPYWDWNQQSQAPEFGFIWGADANSFGQSRVEGCVTQGAFANYQVVYPEQDCLRREPVNMGTFLSSAGLDSIIQRSTTYDQLRISLEGSHGSVHVAIGGQMSGMGSPNDPIFFLHHSNVDRQWARWQYKKPSLAQTYDGDGVQPTDQLYPYNEAVQDMFDTRTWCYFYHHVDSKGHNDNGEAFEVDDHRLAQLVRIVQARAPGSNAPGPLDRSDLFDVHTMMPLPDKWVKMNRLNVSKLRQCEADMQKDVVQINSQPDFADSCLWNDEEFLMRFLLAKAAESPNFSLKVGPETVDVHIDPKDGANWLFNFRSQIRNLLIMLASGGGGQHPGFFQ